MTAALLDVIIHYKNLINKTLVRECPFSDHKYVVATLESKSTRPIEEFCNLRNLNVKNQDIIKNIIDNFDFSDLDNILEINEKWLSFKNRILDAINSVSPLKQVKIKFLDENSPCGWTRNLEICTS